MDEKDKKIEDLEGALADKAGQLTAALSAKTDLEKDLVASKAFNLELKTQVDAQAKTILANDKELSDAADIVVDLKKKLAEKPVAEEKPAFPVLKLGKDKFELLEPAFNYRGVIVDQAALEADSDLLKELIVEGVSFLRKVK
ncbi:hypothetical protein G8759_31275 [Spirosoma aureum]|uniref:Uncharacterized protein n=1 Tax=Spirosoma aureum TaxID=2692134 RepID=A0A6G9AWT3_9BACT|nr:hypothetical protein [Spirosoma aureum]QIP16806.1 hypothetical protein G8759_31275 [Spirosoma aureum]